MICSTLSGLMAIKHPELGTLVREDGAVLSRIGKSKNKAHWSFGCVDGRGYSTIRIYRKTRKIHRLVAECFIPNPDNKPTVDHKDRVRTNNSVSNLRWATHKEQVENSAQVLNRKPYGVRYCEDKVAYTKIHNKEYYESHREEFRKRNALYYAEHKTEILEKLKKNRNK